MLKKALSFVLLMSLCCSTSLGQATQPASNQTDVPVRGVVLFSSGVGYFEHFGSVRGDSSTTLRFKTGQINDILKSLVLQDLDGGRVSTITYPSQDPIAKTLRSFQVDITNNPPLADLLNQLRGAKVTITAQTEKITGTVLGVEQKQKPAGERSNPITVSVINILTGATIRAIELDTVNSLVLDDQQLQEELGRALEALAQARDQDKKPVTINFAGQGDRRVKLGYVVETPVWKTSYRLIMDKAGGNLQGWAIVENQTESDWNNVQLSLVSGRPISFVMDLYQPLYVTRPLVVQELYASLRPKVYDAGIVQNEELARLQGEFGAGRGGRGGGVAGAGGGAGGGGRGRGAPAAPPALAQQRAGVESSRFDAAMAEPMNVTASVQSIASASKVGELFQYTVGNVTLPRQKSAMLPIITDKVEVERLSIYNASTLPKNPLNGARLKNTTDKHLLQGPITVLDANSYAGDAQIDNLPPGQERLLSYGIDLQVIVDNTKQTSPIPTILSGKIVKGVLDISRKHQFSQEYVVDNKADESKTLIIEHPIRHGWKLINTEPAPMETTQSLYRFKLNLPAKKPGKFNVQEEIVNSETLAILPTDTEQLLIYSRQGEFPKAVRDALIKAIQLKQAMVDTDRQIMERNQQLSDITQEQNRIRQNMGTVDRTSPLYTRLVTKLNDQESEIEKLQTDRAALQKKLDTQRAELETYLINLTVG